MSPHKPPPLQTKTQTQTQPLQLRLMGTPLLSCGTSECALDRKAAGALAWMALRGLVARLRLAALLWPGASPEGARNNLRQQLFRLKKSMGRAVVEGRDELRLAPEIEIDAAGLNLLEGCTYDDCPELASWVEQARNSHRQQHRQTLAEAGDAAMAAGEADRALALARELLADDGLSEPAHLRLVQALYLHGDRAAALDAAAQAERVLCQGLGVEPSAAMQALVHLVRSTEAPRPDTAIPVSVLKPPRLIGRESELKQLAQARLEHRIVMLRGEPGLGKSRLLAESALGEDGWLLLATRPGDAAVPFAA